MHADTIIFYYVESFCSAVQIQVYLMMQFLFFVKVLIVIENAQLLLFPFWECEGEGG